MCPRAERGHPCSVWLITKVGLRCQAWGSIVRVEVIDLRQPGTEFSYVKPCLDTPLSENVLALEKTCLYVELDIMKPEEQIAQSKAEDNSDHLDISLVKEEQMLKYNQQV